MKTLEELKELQNEILILHYACTDVNKSPVIITSISIKDYSTKQTLSFSFDSYGDEKSLLSEFVNYMKKHEDSIIVTWNQKSSTYGIQHIQRRCKELNVTDNFPINLEQVTDLDDIYTERYGRNYVNNPKLRCLAEQNNITLKGFVDGLEEIRLFHEKEYKKIENSVNRKVNVIADYLTMSFNNQLKVSKNEDKDTKRKSHGKVDLKKIGKILGVIAIIIGAIASSIAIMDSVEKRIDNSGDAQNANEMPIVIPVLNSDSDNVCQKTIQFFSGEAKFNFTYANKGNSDGNFVVTVSSDEVLSNFKNSSQEFKKESQINRYVDARNNQEFNFILKIEEQANAPEKISIKTSLECQKFTAYNSVVGCGTVEKICTYKNIHTTTFGPNYELVE